MRLTNKLNGSLFACNRASSLIFILFSVTSLENDRSKCCKANCAIAIFTQLELCTRVHACTLGTVYRTQVLHDTSQIKKENEHASKLRKKRGTARAQKFYEGNKRCGARARQPPHPLQSNRALTPAPPPYITLSPPSSRSIEFEHKVSKEVVDFVQLVVALFQYQLFKDQEIRFNKIKISSKMYKKEYTTVACIPSVLSKTIKNGECGKEEKKS